MKKINIIILLFTLFLKAQTKELKIGDYYQGGIIFFIEKDNTNTQKGLIVSINDVHKGTQWSNIKMELVGEELNYDKEGEINTIKIINQKNHNESAAKLCNEYIYDEYNDWYLPSLQEFSLMFNNKDLINPAILSAKGDLLNNKLYWTSNEYMNGFAWVFPFYFSSMQAYEVDKINLYPVRAIRKF